MSFSNLTGNCANGAFSCASRAAFTFVCVDGERKKTFASACGTSLVLNVCNVFVSEITKRAEYRVRSRLTKTAKRCGLNGFCQFF